MSDENTNENGNAGASEPSSTDEPGTGGDGGAGGDGGSGGGAPADSFAGERDRLTKAARDNQSRADRLQAELDRIRAAASGQPEPKGDEPARTSTDVGLLFDLRDERDALKAEFGEDADPTILSRYRDFSSPEELRMAVEQRVDAAKALRERLEREAEERIRKQYEERHGPLKQEPAGGNSGSTGLPSIEQLAAMSVRELDEVDAKHGAGTVERILADATRAAGA